MSPPRRRDSRERPKDTKRSRKYSRSPRNSRSPADRRQARSVAMDVSEDLPQNSKGELKIKGQAQVEKKKSKWDSGETEGGPSNSTTDKLELEKRENELKEKALRNKVVRTRKGSNGGPS
ncbi:hypothetical protein BV22DRAFT_1126422 [Leucogyrophana mollusca]|uniref:Uncharacterized protein n=1 Tax=Leucogyrophana mollusca TaxID=85980 RepID=A0ACB8BT26_9AGAM|nr:hypothetical protein BV22DRAFT_1126422 [Leucogyrophana mollusca]